MGSSKQLEWQDEFSEEAYELTQPEIGLKLITTVDSRGWPHVTMISSNRAKTPTQVVWGQFTEGTSKKNILNNSKQGMFYMNAEMPYKFVQAKVDYEHLKHGGEDCEHFSRGRMFRYLTYVNVHTCYYNNVKAVTSVRGLGLGGIVRGLLTNVIAKGGTKVKNPENKLPVFGQEIFNQMTSVKVISFIDTDGYPVIIPCFGLNAPDRSRLVFPLSQFKEDLEQIPEGAKVAVYVVVSENLELTNMMINGTFTGFDKFRGFKYGIIEIDEIYNSMPPLHGIIYPEIQTRPKVTDFKL
ncbi:MAG: hypothetical protein ACXAEU_23525 [Candidatus Hodarchaeales archaeon]|jgi:hypothetical protein